MLNKYIININFDAFKSPLSLVYYCRIPLFTNWTMNVFVFCKNGPNFTSSWNMKKIHVSIKNNFLLQ